MPEFRVPCILFRQRQEDESPQYAVLVAPADDVLKWAAIRRREDEVGGPQRRLNKSKINAIRRFFSLDKRNTIPPAMTVTLNVSPDDITDSEITIRVPDGAADEEKPGLVIDGQHRLLGLKDLGYHVAVVALLNVDDMEKAFQFLVINKKVTPVSPDLIRTLALDYEQDALKERLVTARLNLDDNLRFVGIMDRDKESPFAGHIALVTADGDEENRFIAPAAIENAVAVVQRAKNVRELQVEDAMCDFLYSIWTPIRERWPELWCAESRLTTKVGFVAMTMFMTKALIAKYDWGELDVSDPAEVQEVVGKILDSLTKDFWVSNWTIKANDSAAVRKKIVQSLEEVTRNIRQERQWDDEIDLIEQIVDEE